MPAMVVIPSNGYNRRRVLVDQVHSVLSNRIQNNEEQYLLRWNTKDPTTTSPISWHSISELVRCLEYIQDYLETRERSIKASYQAQIFSKKRKSPDSGTEHERQPSPLARLLQQDSRTPSASRSSSVSSAALSISPTVDTYNGVLDADKNGFIYCRPEFGPDVPQIDVRTIPTPEMSRIAHRARVDTALKLIRDAYVRRLARVPGKPIHLINLVDASTPSLRFRYISDYVFDEQQGVYPASSGTQVGCLQCSPHMGRNIGCEYTKKCDCLEYAAVDESRITDPEMRKQYEDAIANGGSTIGFPKKFPYFAEGTKREKTGCLVPFYLDSRRPIYECNDKCHCGPYCRNKNVQFGRMVELEIFRTTGGRGWGLRCKEDLHEGQFIDTYRGEVITDAEATRRENASSKAKASYLYSLDKFAESENIDAKDIYVVDGEFMGGPTKFMNHSCEPNCRQYTVSYNKHDPRVYDIAFFACRFIPAGEELTFDYLDKDEDEPMGEPVEDSIACLCGAARCRKWLWT
ncbi:Nn.00g016020.m01.CDS01 [Neocucurbitaria sp. VM-36]